MGYDKVEVVLHTRLAKDLEEHTLLPACLHKEDGNSPPCMDDIRPRPHKADCKTRICWKYVETMKSIISKNKTRTQIWNDQCFAKWLNVQSTQPDGQLIHTVLLHQVDNNLEPEFDGISYFVGVRLKKTFGLDPASFV
ncbi:hypothetical protein R6Q57_010470 [Mikania cordata]